MIARDMRNYDYFTLGGVDAYGQPQNPSINDTPVGTIKMAINISSQAVQDNVNYKDCNYIGLTQAEVNDTYVIKYGNELLKVLYVNPKGRMKQVFLGEL
jgi:hypothetical protein